MTTSPIHNRFLANQEDLGVVAVGFSGGQVCLPCVCEAPLA